ncbi:amidohydrolase [Roseimaritima sediminicola]|uniref:amidohydrolase n=1 Tax=Roseimaritima sediminicola TaxID=2662066 RepID=UPI00129826FD|nr:amidohydrolase [Roseimaritima sediminicola]
MTEQTPEPMQRLDALMSHVWMVRTFLKHCDEVEDDEELQSVVRDLYDVLLAVGPASAAGDAAAYLKMLKKKRRRLQRATELFVEIQPEVSGHTNFAMAARSLATANAEIQALSQAEQSA